MEAMAAFMHKRSEEHARARREVHATTGGEDEDAASAGPADGRSGDAAIREVLAAHRGQSVPTSPDRAPTGPPPGAIKQGWLLLRHDGNWHRRFFVLEASGALRYHRGGRDGGAAPKALGVGAGPKGSQLQQQLAPPKRTDAAAAAAGSAEGTQQQDPRQQDPQPLLPPEQKPKRDPSDTGGPLDDPDIPYGVHEDAAELAGALTGLWSFGTSVIRGAVTGAKQVIHTAMENPGVQAAAALAGDAAAAAAHAAQAAAQNLAAGGGGPDRNKNLNPNEGTIDLMVRIPFPLSPFGFLPRAIATTAAVIRTRRDLRLVAC